MGLVADGMGYWLKYPRRFVLWSFGAKVACLSVVTSGFRGGGWGWRSDGICYSILSVAVCWNICRLEHGYLRRDVVGVSC